MPQAPPHRSPVEDCMTSHLITVGPDEPVFAALERMAGFAIRHVLVTEDGELKGIVSNRDIVRSASLDAERRLEFHDVPVSRIMTPMPLATVTPETSVSEAAQIMVDRMVNALPVLRQGRLVGVVTSEDLLRVLSLCDRAPSRPDL